MAAPGNRLILGLAAVLVASLLAPATSSAGHRPPPAPRLDTATATGDNLIVDDFSSTEIEVDAFSGPSGEDPGGSVSFIAGQILPISGPVSCLDVTANTAVMTVQGPFPSAPGFLGFSVRLVDNGGSGLDSFEYWPVLPETPEPADCRAPSADWFGGVLLGRAVVTDAPALPTSKWQCRHGGFIRYGFASKRQCFRFVRRHHQHR